MSRCFSASAWLVLIAFNAYAAESSIDWQVANRFRAFDYLKRSPCAQSEVDKEPVSVATFNEYTNGGRAQSVADVFAQVIRCGSPWRNGDTGPWAERTGEVDPGYDREFVSLPKRLRIDAKLINSVARVGQNCRWQLAASQRIAPCDGSVTIEIDRDGELLTVVDDAGETIAAERVAPTLKVIAGLGDSYAAGEGSPDTPTGWKVGAEHRDWHQFVRADADAMVREDAAWYSNRCNRSFYSYQNLVALTIAARERHSVVSFVHFACAGAEVIDGLLAPQRQVARRAAHCPPSVNPQDAPNLDGYPDPQCDAPKSQVAALAELICPAGVQPLSEDTLQSIKGRFDALAYAPSQSSMIIDLVKCTEGDRPVPIDLLMLSIGGNDMGFAGVIAWGLLPFLSAQDWRAGSMSQGKPTVKRTAEEVRAGIRPSGTVVCPNKKTFICSDSLTAVVRIHDVGKRLDILNAVLIDVVAPRAVLLNTYPSPLTNSRNRTCPDKWGVDNAWYAIRLNFEVSVRNLIPLGLIKSQAEVIYEDVVVPLNAELVAAAAKMQTPWLIGHAESVFDRAGWCVGELLTLGTGAENLATWTPYEFRGRFIQTINDSFRTQWAKPPMDSGYSGSFHPNPYGYEKMAEAAFAGLERRPARRVIQP